MAHILDTFLPSETYNGLPSIGEVARAPEKYSKDLQDLRELLDKHHVPTSVSIRLIHKHFDTNQGEVMVFGKVSVPPHGLVKIMKPVKSEEENTRRRGTHYFVSGNAKLQAYEYSEDEVPDMTDLESFLLEFCRLVSERKLERIFGLKLQCEDDKDDKEETGWTEYEFQSSSFAS